MKTSHLLILFLICNQICYAQTNFEIIDKYLDSLAVQDQYSGYVLIAEGDEIRLSKGYGFADRELKLKNEGFTQFNLSSSSKLFTAIAIAQLMEQGKISLEDTIGTYIPDLTYSDKVTVKHLLTHSSGLPYFFQDIRFSYEGIKNCTDMVPLLKTQKLQFEPGDSVIYSSVGTFMLGAIIEKVTGLTYQEYVEREILKPAGMTHTSFENYYSTHNLTSNTYSKGHVKDSVGNIVLRKSPENEKHFVPLSSGGVWSSAEDIFRFHKAVFSGKLIKKETLALMLSPKTFTGWPDCYFGYIWININEGKPTRAVGHAGNSSGHHSTYYNYDINDTTIILLTNYGFVDIFEVAENIENLTFGK